VRVRQCRISLDLTFLGVTIWCKVSTLQFEQWTCRLYKRTRSRSQVRICDPLVFAIRNLGLMMAFWLTSKW